MASRYAKIVAFKPHSGKDTQLEHEVKPIAPQYVKPFMRRQKNDAADAIVIAAQRPEMSFVEAPMRRRRSLAARDSGERFEAAAQKRDTLGIQPIPLA